VGERDDLYLPQNEGGFWRQEWGMGGTWVPYMWRMPFRGVLEEDPTFARMLDAIEWRRKFESHSHAMDRLMRLQSGLHYALRWADHSSLQEARDARQAWVAYHLELDKEDEEIRDDCMNLFDARLASAASLFEVPGYAHLFKVDFWEEWRYDPEERLTCGSAGGSHWLIDLAAAGEGHTAAEDEHAEEDDEHQRRAFEAAEDEHQRRAF